MFVGSGLGHCQGGDLTNLWINGIVEHRATIAGWLKGATENTEITEEKLCVLSDLCGKKNGTSLILILVDRHRNRRVRCHGSRIAKHRASGDLAPVRAGRDIGHFLSPGR